MGTWNIQTVTPGFSDNGVSDDLQEIDNARKTAVIDMELNRLQMDIVSLQEMRLPDSRSVKKKNLILLAGKTIEWNMVLALWLEILC